VLPLVLFAGHSEHEMVLRSSVLCGTACAVQKGTLAVCTARIRLMPACAILARLSFGGSLIRPEATGYGLIYFLEEMIKGNNDELKVRRCD